jgi:hypothetical protein
MKKLLVMTCMVFGCVFAASAQDAPGVTAQERAKNLSDQMIRDLGLNNYQSKKVNEINLEVAKQMLAIEQKFANNEQKVEELCKGVCDVRDQKLENVLSTVQYNNYFGDRKNLTAMDKKFMAEATMKSKGGNGGVASAENPSTSASTVSVN